MKNYQFNLTWSEEDDSYIATCPEFYGLSAFGDTPEEALAEAKIALELFIESYEADKIPLPEPNIVKEYSGQIRLRLPKSLHQQAAKRATIDGISLNQYICYALQAKVSADEVSETFNKKKETTKYSLPNPAKERITI